MYKNTIIMKRLLFFVPCLALMLASCGNDNDFHVTRFYETAAVMYADQEVDSLHLQYSDNWTAQKNVDWFDISPTSATIPQDYIMWTRIDITTTPNTTGKERIGNIMVTSYQPAGITVYQHSFLNVSWPYITNVSEDESTFTCLDIKADTATTGQVIFTNYADGATLTSNSAWLTVSNETYDKGRHQVDYTLEPNTTTEDRTAIITLTSNGVSTPISIRQRAYVEAE